MNFNIRRVYLYLTSLVGLVLVLIGGVQLINLGLKTYIFTKADDVYDYGVCARPVAVELGKPVPEFDETACKAQQADQRTARRQSDAARSIAFIIVGAPVWLYHWGKVKDERDQVVPS
ncbi:MAG: hypothetical protein A2846_03160 [Candidatus Doudnabacteria bacterium RIFCSPHIGHO2_01_FULL_49_9]|uniref:DUF5671 domain-containing protein n=1 Tax=Candidatus Doudnabacteria bacterium RIFCSPHIGHO2_01_FULL_49_9 TaxID=1817827 RepID=A0A1F5P2D1_9BACT|nr:MAG: hypothetical protein A2846_03160 [Candidatus Doudnabacteria bacterium RIFCSPHIGHO2_01_FULL_49_9]